MQTNHIEPPRRGSDGMLAGGIVLTVLAALGIPFFGLMALLTANPCGAFGDACDEHGQVGEGFGVSVALLALSIAGVVAGIVLIVVSRRSAHRSQ